MRRRDSELVYSSDDGDLRRGKGAGGGRSPKGRRKGPQPKRERAPRGTRMKVRRETSGRKGKAVTTVSDIPLGEAEVKRLAVELKRRCGVGGTAKNGVIELQGDHRGVVLAYLAEQGHDAVAAGG